MQKRVVGTRVLFNSPGLGLRLWHDTMYTALHSVYRHSAAKQVRMATASNNQQALVSVRL